MTQLSLGPVERAGLVAYLGRVVALDDRAAVRLQARGLVAGVWSGPPFGVLALRPVALLDDADVDTTVSAQRLLEALERPGGHGRGGRRAAGIGARAALGGAAAAPVGLGLGGRGAGRGRRGPGRRRRRGLPPTGRRLAGRRPYAARARGRWPTSCGASRRWGRCRCAPPMPPASSGSSAATAWSRPTGRAAGCAWAAPVAACSPASTNPAPLVALGPSTSSGPSPPAERPRPQSPR